MRLCITVELALIIGFPGTKICFSVTLLYFLVQAMAVMYFMVLMIVVCSGTLCITVR